MKLLLSVVALVAFTQAAPTTTHMVELGSNGITGSVNTHLVSIEVNIIKDGETSAPEAVNNPVLEAEPIIVVDTPIVAAPTPVEVVDVNPTPVEVVDVIPEIAMPAPVEVVDFNPTPVEIVDVIPEIAIPAPVEVIGVNPTPVEVVDVNPTPAEVVDMSPGAVEAGASSSQIINVILNFVFGSNGAISSVEVPPQTVNQLVGMARSL